MHLRWWRYVTIGNDGLEEAGSWTVSIVDSEYERSLVTGRHFILRGCTHKTILPILLWPSMKTRKQKHSTHTHTHTTHTHTCMHLCRHVLSHAFMHIHIFIFVQICLREHHTIFTTVIDNEKYIHGRRLHEIITR